MKNILFGSLVTMALIAATGCSGTDTGAKSAKCGGDKKAEKAMKCGADKKADKGMKCAAGKCGGDKK